MYVYILQTSCWLLHSRKQRNWRAGHPHHPLRIACCILQGVWKTQTEGACTVCVGMRLCRGRSGTETYVHPFSPWFIRVCDVCDRSEQPARFYYPITHLELYVWSDSSLGLGKKVQIRLFTDASSVKSSIVSSKWWHYLMRVFQLYRLRSTEWMRHNHKRWTSKHMRDVPYQRTTMKYTWTDSFRVSENLNQIRTKCLLNITLVRHCISEATLNHFNSIQVFDN
jgi:hypothetical protein